MLVSDHGRVILTSSAISKGDHKMGKTQRSSQR